MPRVDVVLTTLLHSPPWCNTAMRRLSARPHGRVCATPAGCTGSGMLGYERNSSVQNAASTADFAGAASSCFRVRSYGRTQSIPVAVAGREESGEELCLASISFGSRWPRSISPLKRHNWASEETQVHLRNDAQRAAAKRVSRAPNSYRQGIGYVTAAVTSTVSGLCLHGVMLMPIF